MIKIKQYKSIVLPIKTSKENIDYLFKCNKETAKVWNECIRLHKKLWTEKQEYVDRKYLQDHIKGSFSNILAAKCMQITIKKYLQAVKAVQQARKIGRTDEKYPWRQKKNYNTTWDNTQLKIDYDKNIIRIPRPKYFNVVIDGKRKLNPLFLKFRTKLPP